MQSMRKNWLIVFAFGFIFTYLFYNHGMGVNTLLFALFIVLFAYVNHSVPKTKIGTLVFVGFFASALGVVIGHTDYSLGFFWIHFVLILGVCVYPKGRYVHRAFLFSFKSLSQLPNTIGSLSFGHNQKGNNVKQLGRFVALPIGVFFLLLKLYASANPHFAKSLETLSGWFPNISISLFGFMLLGILLAILLSTSLLQTKYDAEEQQLQTSLLRIKNTLRSWNGLTKRLLRKQQVAIVFFVLINIMAFWLNVLDIRFLWFNYSWDGGYLKEMVHEGTYLLILAILISMGIALYYLNSNIVWMQNQRKLFQMLIIIWLAQNAFMVFSVAIRNSYYIEHFALAYKRIFVYYFLLACLVGIGSIIYKTLRFKNTTFLLHVNSLCVYLIFLSATFLNWDAIIARYNFSNYQKSFVHYSFLMELNDAALPYLIDDMDQLAKIDNAQVKQFEFSKRGAYNSLSYPQIIAKRKLYFKEVWEKRSWQDWNYAEANAYEKLK